MSLCIRVNSLAHASYFAKDFLSRSTAKEDNKIGSISFVISEQNYQAMKGYGGGLNLIHVTISVYVKFSKESVITSLI